MKLAAAIDRVLGRAQLEIEDGSVFCPIRGGLLDVEACSSCPHWKRTEIDVHHHHGVVICRTRTLCGGEATGTPPV